MISLPIDPLLPQLKATLEKHSCAVLQAPPGAGKSTRVPLALLDAVWLKGQKIVMLEPRRLAARATAHRMAETLGESVGQTVGYRVRFDTRISKSTRIEVVTDGLFLRRLQADPELRGIGAVLFDEFHERGLEGDLSLALARETQILREDLRLLIMSATLDAAPIARLLNNAPILTSEGRSFPVETCYLTDPFKGRIEEVVVRKIRQALNEESGSILAFLPGQAEIRRVQELLGDFSSRQTIIAPLYGDLSQQAQNQAITPAPPGQRKIVLSTAIAETSLTIEGIRIVIDSGLMRKPRFDPRTGLTRLETCLVSQASADQRRGRAGRLEAGICYRLWTEAQHRLLPRFTPPEILEADLASLSLELANWGVNDAMSLTWLDPPPAPTLNTAHQLLQSLGALNQQGHITAHGRKMAEIGLHPRLAHMILRAQKLGLEDLAIRIAALIGERDILRSDTPGKVRPSDLHWRLNALQNPHTIPAGLSTDRAGLAHAKKTVAELESTIASPSTKQKESLKQVHEEDNNIGLLTALAYPDRVAQRRSEGPGQFRLRNGRGATLPTSDPLAKEDYLAVAAIDDQGQDGRILLAAPVSTKILEQIFSDQIQSEDSIYWNSSNQAVLSRRKRLLGALILKDDPLPQPDPEKITEAFLNGIRHEGLSLLPWTPETENWRSRVMFLQRVEPDISWPDVSDTGLLATLDQWLKPSIYGASRREHLTKINLLEALESLLDWNLRQRLEQEAPTHLIVPSGSRIKLDYTGDIPVLAVRLQEMFGQATTPRVAGGRVPVLIHLLSPAYRPVQVTKDLASFWANTYAEVRADLRGRYPKHAWPEDPLAAHPTRRTKRSDL